MKKHAGHALRSIHDLREDDQNANRGTPRGEPLIIESLRLHGTGRSLLIDRNGTVIAGNKTLRAAKALNLPIRVVPFDGKFVAVLQRLDLDLSTDRSARELAVRDNRIAELNLNWDPQRLLELQAQGASFAGLWTEKQWKEFGASLTNVEPAADRILEPRDTPIQRGDLFRLGEHRLLCGNATDAANVASARQPSSIVAVDGSAVRSQLSAALASAGQSASANSSGYGLE